MTGAPTHTHKRTCNATVVAAAARKVVYAAAAQAAEAAAPFSAGFQCRRRRCRIRIWLLCALVEIEIKI